MNLPVTDQSQSQSKLSASGTDRLNRGTGEEARPLFGSLNVQIDDSSLSDEPGPRLLQRWTTFGHGALYASRAFGSAMFTTGITSHVCHNMMDSPHHKENEFLLISLGTVSYLTGAICSALTSTERCGAAFTPPGSIQCMESVKQSLKDAVVPAIVAFSVYLALAHHAI